MASIDAPRPRTQPGSYLRRELPTESILALPSPIAIQVSIDHALRHRRSAEQFCEPKFADLAMWLYYIAGVHSTHRADSNRQRRYVSSFGALHPAHILVRLYGEWHVYLPNSTALGRLLVVPEVDSLLCDTVDRIYAAPSAALVALLSDVDLAMNYYEDPHELLLRDAGVLMGHAALVAASLGLGFRILGATGSPYLENLIMDVPFTSKAMGLALLGGAPSSDG